ncbi:hypothetical protein H4Q26_018348, partial [Puccinia striiformis f. sp. tritici PST-130]
AWSGRRPNANGQKSGLDPKDVGLSSNPNGEEAPNGQKGGTTVTPPIKDATPPPTKDNTPAPVTPPPSPPLPPTPQPWPLSPSLPPEVFDMPKT